MRRIRLIVALALFTLGACSSKSGSDTTTTTATGGTTPTTSSSLRSFETKPPWPLPDRMSERIMAAGLPLLTAEGSLVHFHAHLDVFDNGQPVTVPAYVGIDFTKAVISPLHTHFDTGVLHVESAATEAVTLGQFLTEWGVRITDGCIGDVCAPGPIALYVNGQQQTGDPRSFVIAPDIEIALILGTPPTKIPKGYACVNPQDACPATPAP